MEGTRPRARSFVDGCIVAFEGEVRDVNGLPLLWRFDEEEEVLLQLSELPATALHHAASFYREGDKDDRFHNCGMPQDGQGKTVTT